MAFQNRAPLQESFAYTVYRIASSFASLDDRDTIVTQALALLGDVCDAGRAYLFLFDWSAGTMDNTHEWCAPGVSAEIEGLRNLPLDMFPWWMQRLKNGDQIHIPDVAQLPPEAAAEQEILQGQEIRSVLVLPVYREGRLGGFIGLDNVRSAATWAPDTREYLQVAAELVGSTITRDDRARNAEARRAELQEAYEHLKQTQTQLLQSEKLASIGMLAAGVAHEINNPVAYVTSNTATLRQYLEDMRRLVEAALAGTEPATLGEMATSMDLRFILEDSDDIIAANLGGLRKVADIVKNLMAFSRVNEHDQIEVTDIHQGIRNTLDIAAHMLKYTVEVDFRPGDDVPPIRCNLGELNQVFLNVLVNATQAITATSRERKGHIAIVTHVADGMVHCVIRDDGPGFPEDQMHRVFEPFFTTKEVGEGTGLGMSIAYDIIVNKHQGRLEIGNNDDGGAFVHIRLPLVTSTPTAET
mgnify:CR=1 FL=1|tara:strand:- start:160 stop:1569 length:1410 start_codon:yes stop_codon:yes gene_type:complete